MWRRGAGAVLKHCVNANLIAIAPYSTRRERRIDMPSNAGSSCQPEGIARIGKRHHVRVILLRARIVPQRCRSSSKADADTFHSCDTRCPRRGGEDGRHLGSRFLCRGPMLPRPGRNEAHAGEVADQQIQRATGCMLFWERIVECLPQMTAATRADELLKPRAFGLARDRLDRAVGG